MMSPAVSIVKCQSYDEKGVLDGLRRSLDLLGGIESVVRRGDRVLLKPNLLAAKSPVKAVTTHPSMIRGMIQIVRDGGGIPSIGDSPGIGSAAKVADRAGIAAVAKSMDCPIVDFNRPVLFPESRGKTFRNIEIDRAVLEADVVINLPKWKTHAQMLLTLGVKNLFGCVPGKKKALWHLKAGEDRLLFARMLVDIYEVVRPGLTVLDGVVGMEGNGPGSGPAIPLGLILASRDALSVDQVACDLLGIPRRSLMTNRVALDRGLGKEAIDIIGEKVEEVKIPAFQLPSLTRVDWNLPGFIRKALKNALSAKPAIDEALCKNCGQCAEICPPRALQVKGKTPSFDYGRCIRCFCCLEVCPEGAVSIKQGWAVKLAGRKR